MKSCSKMKAMIFAAGVGSRLKPWTDSHPKALVEVCGTPVLDMVINRIIATGIRQIIINIHHFPEQIVNYVESRCYDADIIFSDESDKLLETGGGLRKVLDLLDNEPVLLHNADILTDFPLNEMIETHFTKKSDITLLTQSRKTSRYFVFNNQRMKGWTNIETGRVRPEGTLISDQDNLRAFNGIHILNPQAYSHLRTFMPDETPFSIVDFYIQYCNLLDISSFELTEKYSWFDIGKPQTLDNARNFYSKISV